MPEACNFIKKESLTQVISCEFCKISQNTFFTEHLRTTAFVISFKFEQKNNEQRGIDRSLGLDGSNFPRGSKIRYDCDYYFYLIPEISAEEYLEPCQISKMEL